MYKAVQHCNNCGADLTLDDLRGTNCPYCKVVYPHHSQAQQHVQVVNQVMGQMMNQQAQIQNQWRGAFGVGPVQPPPPMGPPTMGSGAPGSPYPPYDPNQMMNAHMHHAQQMSRRITTIVLIATLGSFVLVGAIIALTMLL